MSIVVHARLVTRLVTRQGSREPADMGKRSNGEGTVRRNVERSRWEARFTVGNDGNGRPVRKMATGATKVVALKRMREAQDAAASGRDPVRRDHTVGRYLGEWLDDVLPGTVAAATEGQYREVVRRYIIPCIGRKHLATLSAGDVSKMLRDMATPTAERPNGYSPTSQRLARSILRTALAHAEREGHVSRNVAALAKGVPQQRSEGRTMTPAEATKFLIHIRGDRDEAAYVVALSCGLRVSELLGLAWDCVSIDSTPATIDIRRGLKYVPGLGLLVGDVKTTTSRRTVHLTEQAVVTLKRHRAIQRAERLKLGRFWNDLPLGVDFVFRTVDGTARDPSNFRKALSATTNAAGLGHWHPHELRHSAASLLLAQGVSLKTIADTLGHSSITVTANVYAHLLDDARAEAAEAMSRALSG